MRKRNLRYSVCHEKNPKIISRVVPKSTSDKKASDSVDYEEDTWDKTEEILEGVEQLDLSDEIED